MTQWKSPRYSNVEVPITFNGGVNVTAPIQSIPDGQASALWNMDSRHAPALSVRPPRKPYVLHPTSDNQYFSAFGARQVGSTHVVMLVDSPYWTVQNAGTTTWFNASTVIGAGNYGSFDEFNTGVTDYTVYGSSAGFYRWDGSTASTCVTAVGDSNAPKTELFAVYKGRVYGLSGKTIKYCALNKSSDWTTANDAGSITVTNAPNDLTAIAEYDDKLIIWSLYTMHILRGSGPNTYELQDVEGDIGCIYQGSVVKCNGALYWMDYKGVYEYRGGMPVKISGDIAPLLRMGGFDYWRRSLRFGSQDKYLYINMFQYYASASPATRSNTQYVLKYDTELRQWFVENAELIPDSSAYISQFANIADKLLSVNEKHIAYMRVPEGDLLYNFQKEGVDYSTGSTEHPIAWTVATKLFTDNKVKGHKTLTSLHLLVDRSTSSTEFNVHYTTKSIDPVGSSANWPNTWSTASTSKWTLLSSTVAASTELINAKMELPVNALQNTNHYALRFSGKGFARIHEGVKTMRVRER